ncbi:ribosomal-protein-alanine acetyltransferase [Brevibacillus sp. SKDU10]|uniref:ribosomal protein S18-alanine N-acetyltransferase n=1 Tax=Brevibacillus sp. SKDU10 TaxID=1247872 RepID=UPI0007C8CB44|nr:ribosomal protein S18-alanine N-acetyltransferase [Brevibacillus sp. SKDU10]OAJ72631.1 ribosomal-protein-alanine acetyltransferase [Brevibacillus sp. SKDU10]
MSETLSKQLEFRYMTLDDVERIAELERICFPTPWPLEAFINELTINPNAKYIVAVLDGQVVGYCGMWLIIDEAHITNICIHPDVRGQRVGLQLMKQMMALAMVLGGERMTLEVRPSNEIARNLYTKLGFEEHGRRKRYYSDNNEDAIIMWVNLREE